MDRAAPSLRICGPAAASLLVNGLIVAALLGLQMRRTDERPKAPNVTTVSFAMSKGQDHGEEDAPAQASPAITSPPPPSPPAEPMLQTAPAVVPPALPIVAQLPTPAASISVPAPTIAPASPAAPHRSPTGSTSSTPFSANLTAARRGVVDGLNVKAPSGNGRSYAAVVRSWLYAHKVYPRRARMRREEGLVQVRFVLNREGVLLGGAVTGRSGNAVLDQEAEAMLRRSSPYPRAPADLPGDRIEFNAPIEFTLPS